MANRVVRFHAACAWWDAETEALVYVPAMVAAMRSIRTDQLQAIQVTALRPDGSKVSRKMRGPAGGACIKLAGDEMITTALGVTEGFENALAMMLQGWSPIWALGSAGAIENFPVLPGVECLTIFGDHERAGLAAARACAERYRRDGAEVAIRVPKLKDWNDAVLGSAAT